MLVSAIVDHFVDVTSDERSALIKHKLVETETRPFATSLFTTLPSPGSEEYSGTKVYFCFFYCLRTQDERRDPANVLRSFIKQLALANEKAYEILCRRYNRKRRAGFLSETFSVDECEELLKDMLPCVPMTVLILDALDECFLETRGKLIDVLNSLIEYGLPVKVLISSRRDGDIKEQLIEKANVSISATDNEEDIMKFVRERIDKHRETKRGAWAIPSELEQKIVTTIQDKSDGM